MVFFCCAQLGYGQGNILDRTITISFKNLSVKEALKNLSKTADFFLNYAVEDVDSERRITRTFNDIPLENIIREIWGDESIQIQAKGKVIGIISENKEKTTDQKGTLHGRITDGKLKAVPFATVAIKGTGTGVITDERGYFEIKGISEGTHMLVISSMGYESKEQTINIRSGKTTYVSIEVAVSVQALEEVIVEGRSQKVQELIQSAQAVVVVETIEAKTQTADLGEVLTRTEGINVQRSGGLGSGARFNLNGLSNDQIRFFVDGVPLDVTIFTNGIANIPVNLIDRVEVYKGVVPIRFGADALGGAINIITNEAFDGTGGTVSYQTGSFGVHRLSLDVNHWPSAKKYFINTGAFYDVARNDYKVDVEIPDSRGRLRDATVRRFHDRYRARGFNLDVGLRNIRWADRITLKGFYSDTQDDIQNNLTMTLPYGAATSENKSLGGTVNWNKIWNNVLNVENIVGYSELHTEFVDTTTVVFTWDGVPSVDLNGEEIVREDPGELGVPSSTVFTDITWYDRFNFSYKFGKSSSIRFTSAPIYSRRSGENRLLDDIFIDRLALENSIFTWTNGLEYEYNKASERFKVITFLKQYLQSIETERIELGSETTDVSRSTENYGFGTSLRFKLNDKMAFKTSYEWATRLPNLFEVFGDGILTLPFVDLLPERSHNINLTTEYKTTFSNSAYLSFTVNGFLRKVNDLIVLLANGDFSIHQNVASASSRGVEGNISGTSANQRLQLSANGTYIDYINTSTKGEYGSFNGDRIPNRPYFFANTSGSYAFSKLSEKSDEWTLFCSVRFVNEFFRSWESAGRLDTKQTIPNQFTQNLGLTYSKLFGTKKLSITGEIQNLSNANVFDFFGVQRPGRAFYLKAIFNLSK